jgi:hypothetical protein
MIVAMVIMRMVQASCDEIIDMIAVGDRLVPAAGPMRMASIMSCMEARSAGIGIYRADFNNVLIIMVVVPMMEMAIMEVVDVVVVLNGGVAAASPVFVAMVRVGGVIMSGHCCLLSKDECRARKHDRARFVRG